MWIVMILILLVGLFLYYSYTKVMNSATKVKQAEATMNIYLSKKYDLLDNLLTLFSSHTDVTKIHFPVYSLSNSDVDVKEKSDRYMELLETQHYLEELTESIIISKSDVILQNLISEIRENEAQLIACFRFYNGNVTDYNNALLKFPLSFLIKKENYHLISNI